MNACWTVICPERHVSASRRKIGMHLPAFARTFNSADTVSAPESGQGASCSRHVFAEKEFHLMKD